MTCLNCGFLALSDREVGAADRIQLGAKGQAGCPPLDELHCSKNLWVNYNLTYSSLSSEGIFAELQERRRPCKGFMKHIPGRTPHEHRDLEDGKRARRDRVIDVIIGVVLGGAGTVLTEWLLGKLGIKR